MINKAHIKIGDVVYGSSDSVDIMYDENTNVYDKITDMSNTMAYIDIEDNENIEYEDVRSQTVELVDNLESTSTTAGLTANQGRILKEYINELSGEVDTLSNSVDTLNTNVTTLSSNVGILGENISTQMSELSSNKADKNVVDELSSSIDELNSNLDEQNDKLGGLRFGIDGDGNYGYYKADDSFVPFKRSFSYVFSISQRNMSGGKSYMMVIQDLTTGTEKSANRDPSGWATSISGSLTLDGVAEISVYCAVNAQSGTETFKALKDLEIYTIDNGYQKLSSGQSITFNSGWQTAPTLVYVY